MNWNSDLSGASKQESSFFLGLVHGIVSAKHEYHIHIENAHRSTLESNLEYLSSYPDYLNFY